MHCKDKKSCREIREKDRGRKRVEKRDTRKIERESNGKREKQGKCLILLINHTHTHTHTHTLNWIPITNWAMDFKAKSTYLVGSIASTTIGSSI